MTGVVSNALRARKSWSIRTTSLLGTSELELVYKNTRGEERPYSNSKPNASVRIPFGPPVKCEYSKKIVGGEEVGQFKFTNKKRETAVFIERILNNLNVENGVNIFSKKITSLNTHTIIVRYKGCPF